VGNDILRRVCSLPKFSKRFEKISLTRSTVLQNAKWEKVVVKIFPQSISEWKPDILMSVMSLLRFVGDF